MGPGAFLNLLWGTKPPGLIQVWEFDGKRSSYYRSPYGASVLANRLDVYTGVALTHKDHGRSHRGRSDQAIAIAGLWLDIDINGPHKTGGAPDRETAKQVASTYLQPTILVDSGYGLHAWHLFRGGPWCFTSRDDQDAAALASAQWHHLHRQAAQQLGFSIDHAHDLARLMRLPGTYNGKGRDSDTKDWALPGRPVAGQQYAPREHREQLLEIAGQAGDVPISGGQQLALGAATDIKVAPIAGTTGPKIEALIGNVPEFAAAWRHQLGSRAAHWSLSEYDLSLCGQATQAGFSDQELADLIVAHRAAHDDQSGKAQRLDYLRRTVGLVRARDDRDTAADQLEQLRRAA